MYCFNIKKATSVWKNTKKKNSQGFLKSTDFFFKILSSQISKECINIVLLHRKSICDKKYLLWYMKKKVAQI